MGNFCRVCGSLLRWDFSSGRRERVCPRCGPVKEGTGTPVIDSQKGAGNGSFPAMVRSPGAGVPRVRKGVSPRESQYARRIIKRANTVSMGLDDIRSMKNDTVKEKRGPDAPAGWAEAPAMFPFERVRPGQEEFMSDVEDTIDEGGFLLANVPTGIGKTAASLSPAIRGAMENGRTVFFMTSKQSQHAIVVETARKISRRSGKRIRLVDIISKQSMCPRDLSKLPHGTFSFLCKQQSKDGSCPLFRPPPPSLVHEVLSDINDVKRTVELSVAARICPHRTALEAAKEADVLVCDFNYLFSDLRDSVLGGIGKDLSDIDIIVDEAHNLPDRIRDHQSSELPLRMLDEAMDSVSGRRHVRHYLKGIYDIILSIAEKEMKEEREVLLDKRLFVSEIRSLFTQGSVDGSMDLELFLEMLADISRRSGEKREEDPLAMTTQFLEGLLNMKGSHILYLTIPEDRGLDSLRIAFRNLDPAEISGPVFKGCHSAVLMSGTLSPPSMFGDILGLSRKRRRERSYPSPFPRTNRLVLLESGVSTAYKKRGEEMYRRIAERLVSISGRVPGNAAAFFPSYSMMNSVGEYMWGCPKSVIVEERSMSKGDKDAIIGKLETGRERGGYLLLGVMGGSLSEGVDYRDNLLSCVFVIGIPFAPPSLEVQSLRDYFRGKFGYALGEEYSYIYPAMNRILQAAGRSIRSERDRSVVILMEERLSNPRYLKFLPEELRPVELEGAATEQAVSSFF